MESDLLLQWPTLVSWARDTELLWPLGLQRGLFRVEVAAWNAEYVFMDVTTPMTSPVWEYKQVMNATRSEPDQHLHYMQLNEPYMAMWVYTREQMADFIQRPAWTDKKGPGWGPREAAVAGFQWDNPPLGFTSNNLVPISFVKNKVLPISAVVHLESHCDHETRPNKGWCSKEVGDYLIVH